MLQTPGLVAQALRGWAGRRVRRSPDLRPSRGLRWRPPEHVDRIREVETLAVPVGGRRVRADRDAGPSEAGAGRCQRRTRPTRRLRGGGEWSTVRPEEPRIAIVAQSHGEALLVNGAVVLATEQQQVIQPGSTSFRPVADVMRVAVSGAAPGEAAPTVAGRQRPAQSRRHRARLPPNVDASTVLGVDTELVEWVEHLAISTVTQDDLGGVARQPSRRFRGNVRTILQRGLPEHVV